MKTQKKVEVIPEYVEFIPDILEFGKVYISKEYGVCIHNCLCGCGGKSVMDIKPKCKYGWNLIENKDKISFTPSILNTDCPNKSHYIITNNIANFV
jgi:hypothetical protein